MLKNRLTAVVSDEDRTAIATAIQTIKETMPFLMDLTPSERKALAKLGDKSVAFVDKSLELATQNPDFLPRSFDITEMQKDVDLFNSLNAIRQSVVQLLELVEDTAMQAGNEAYSAGLVIYHFAKDAHMNSEGLDQLVDEMSKRFHRKRKQIETE